jgi:hypothetical protein
LRVLGGVMARVARSLLLMLALAASMTAARADDPTIDESAAHWHSVATRAQVVEAWSASRADPTARFWLLSFNPLKYFHSTLSRDEARCRALQPSTAADAANLSSESYGGRAYGRPHTIYVAHRDAAISTSLTSSCKLPIAESKIFRDAPGNTRRAL